MATGAEADSSCLHGPQGAYQGAPHVHALPHKKRVSPDPEALFPAGDKEKNITKHTPTHLYVTNKK